MTVALQMSSASLGLSYPPCQMLFLVNDTQGFVSVIFFFFFFYSMHKCLIN